MSAEEEVLRAIPHRPPFLLVDRLVEMHEDGATTELTVREDFDFFKGHYPGNPIMPGVLICEAVFQSAAVFLVKKFAEGEGAKNITPVLGKISNARFRQVVKPGDVLTIKVTIKEKLGQFYMCSGVVMNGDKRTLNIDYTLAMVEEES